MEMNLGDIYNSELPYGMRQCELITAVKFYQTIMPLDLFLILQKEEELNLKEEKSGVEWMMN